jgi:hypothetical protein
MEHKKLWIRWRRINHLVKKLKKEIEGEFIEIQTEKEKLCEGDI